MASAPWYAVRGDNGFYLATLVSDGGVALDLTLATVRVRASRENGTETFVGFGEVIDPENVRATPNVRYRVAPGDLSAAGIWRLQWQITWAPGTVAQRVETFPAVDTYDTLVVRDYLGPAPD